MEQTFSTSPNGLNEPARKSQAHSPATLTKISEQVLGINWAQFFPLDLGNGEQVEVTDYDTVVAFAKEHFPRIYQSGMAENRFFREEFNNEKKKYYQMVADCFAFRKDGTIFGVFVGTTTDWSSYYIRNCSLVPEYQGSGRYQRFLRYLITILKSTCVSRIEIDVSPSNFSHVHILNKFQFNTSGMNLSERWGSLLRFTKFLNGRAESVFVRQFCDGVVPQIKNNQ